ncbi:hypothetical protein PC129_g22131 [Phytophthora cactorum]|uniref:Uncharacterized protein n=1 Tax=Phytophthora cactorum TaxID=29920 RepID=A0A8T1H3T1_9STRA|nr:hypothetical protein PC129_g22131 [Phytophthora cactorum]
MEIFKWMEWIVARNHALSEVDDPLTRSLAATSGTTHFVAIYGIFTKDGILSQVLLSISPAEYGQSAEVYEMIDADLELYNKDSAMIRFIVADNCATNQAIATGGSSHWLR